MTTAKVHDYMIAIVLAARDHLVALADPPARAVVDAIDTWAQGHLVPEQARGIESEMRMGAATATTRAGVAMNMACEALARAARQVSEGEHARIVAASAMTAVEYATEARLAGAAIR